MPRGRPRKPDHELVKPRKKGIRAPYKRKPVEQRGITYKEPIIIKSFWTLYTMDQVISMSDEEIMQAIDKYLDGFIYRQTKMSRGWDFPIKKEYLAIAPYIKK